MHPNSAGGIRQRSAAPSSTHASAISWRCPILVVRLSYALRQSDSHPGVGGYLSDRFESKIESSVRSNLLRRNPPQEHIVKVHAPVKRFDSDPLIFSMCTDVVAIILFA